MAQLQTKRLMHGTYSSKIASVKQDQTMKQEQSFAMVRTLLLSSVSLRIEPNGVRPSDSIFMSKNRFLHSLACGE